MFARPGVLPTGPPEIERAGREAVARGRPFGLLDGLEQLRGQPGDHMRGMEILRNGYAFYLEGAEPSPQAVFGRVVIVMGGLVYGLKEGRVQREKAPGFQHPVDLRIGTLGI